MAILLSLITAGAFGIGDFFGGLSARRMSAVRVVAGSHLVGLVGVVIAALIIENTFTVRDLGIGMVSGLFGGLGVGLLYRGLARGPMSIVAPITAVTSAAVPALWGVGTGERFAALGWLGIALAFLGIWLVSSSTNESDTPISWAVIGQALLAGAGFGAFFIGLDFTTAESAPWPVVGARLATAGALGLWLMRRRTSILPRSDRSALALVVATGLFDTGSNVLFLYALSEGDLATVSVLSSLYPLSTVLLARVVLSERVSRLQQAGVVLALIAVVMIAASG